MPSVPPSGFVIDTNCTTLTTGTITAAGFNPPGVLWEWELTPVDPAPNNAEQYNFKGYSASHKNGIGFVFNYEFYDAHGLFPYQYADYMDNSNPSQKVRVTSLNDIPPSATQIVKSRDDTKDLLTWTLTVTAVGTVGPLFTPLVDVGVYTVRVYANYDVGKEQLKGAIDARR